jgi:phospholipase C
LLVSPYAKKGYIDSTQLDFTSVLKFIESNWNVASLASRDASANNFLSAFDFTQAPRQAGLLSMTYGSKAISNKAPSIMIFSSYGLALLLTFLAISLAAVRMRKSRVPVKE